MRPRYCKRTECTRPPGPWRVLRTACPLVLCHELLAWFHLRVVPPAHNPRPPLQRSDKMTTTIAHHAFFFWLIACVLLILVSVSSPKLESVSFLNAGTGPDRIHFGAFGYTGSNTTVGYDFPAVFAGYRSALLFRFLPIRVLK